MNFEKEVVKFIKKCPSGREHEYSMDIKYLALDLITEEFDYKALARKAINSDINHRLGFLCEVVAQAASELKKSAVSKRLCNLANALYTKPTRWQYLDPALPRFGKRMLDVSPQNELNKKWRVKSSLTHIDILVWADVHSVKDYATSPQRKTA